MDLTRYSIVWVAGFDRIGKDLVEVNRLPRDNTQGNEANAHRLRE